MGVKSPINAAEDQRLINQLLDPDIALNPYNFVMFAFPWGQKGTPLEKHQGPRKWQREKLLAIAAHLKQCHIREINHILPEVFRDATVSGRGPGKSSLVAWLVLWMMSTALGSTTIVTANTETQLTSRTWAELGKWHTLLINGHWFDRNTKALTPQAWFQLLLQRQLKIDTAYYYAQAQLWTEENPDAFAGVHNHHGILLIYDEASGIPAPIWKVSEGFFTEPIIKRFWMVFSNGRRNTGPFFECFHAHRDLWRRTQLDSRSVEGIDLAVLQSIIDKYGEDSDEARIEVKGQFPRTGDRQFIGREAVTEAQERELVQDRGAPLVMGVDVARFGDDSSCVRLRQGRNGRTFPKFKWKGLKTTQLAERVAELIDKWEPDGVFIDGGGVGGGVIDILTDDGYKVTEVQFGGVADDPEKYADKRTEIWARGAEWLPGGSLDPDDKDLADDMVVPEYELVGASSAKRLESKEKMKKRGYASPDDGDAFMLTFTKQVARRDGTRGSKKGRGKIKLAKGLDYDIFG